MYELVEDDGELMVVVPTYETKMCPCCGSGLFDDMDVCYDCLYEFGHEEHVDDSWTDEPVPVEAYGEVRRKETEPMLMRVSTDAVDLCVPLPECGLVVGRGSTCDIVLHKSLVSRRHVRIVPAGDKVLVQDEGAKNAALLNGKPLKGSVRMAAGDVLSICGTKFSLVAGQTYESRHGLVGVLTGDNPL